MKSLLLIGLGGASGSILRYLTQQLVHYFPTKIFPIGTFTVNIVGCLLIGILYGFLQKHTFFNRNLGLLLITGFCGGYTTFSSFSYESLVLLQEHFYFRFFGYMGLSVFLGLAAVALGLFITK